MTRGDPCHRALGVIAGLFLAAAAQDPGERLGDRAARLEREFAQARDRADADRLLELMPRLDRLKADIEEALRRRGPGHPPGTELAELLNIVRHLRAESESLSANRSWRKSPPPRIEAAPDPSRITIRPEEDGTAAIVGAPGAARDDRARIVRAVNLVTTDEALGPVRADGSFRVLLMAPPGSTVQVSTCMSRDMPEEVRHLLESGRAVDVDDSRPHLRERVAANRTTSPGVILPVPSPGKEQAGFVAKAGRRGWIFGTAKLSRRSLNAGDSVELDVKLTVHLERDPPARRPTIDPVLAPLFDRHGRQKGGSRLLASTLLTPTGLPIESHGDMSGRRREDGRILVEPGSPVLPLRHEPLEPGEWRRRGRASTIRQRIRITIPEDVPEGIYALRGFVWPGAGDALLEGAPPGQVNFGRVTVGQPAPPRLACMLLGSAGTGGIRGTLAREDRGAYGISPHNAFMPDRLVVPRDDARTGKPHPYPLDPYLPLVALTDRPHESRLWPPRIDFDPRGSLLTVTVRRPDGQTDRLGPAPLVAGQNDLSSVCPDRIVLDRLVAPWGTAYGNPSLADIYHLSGGRAFEYAFPSCGRFEVTLNGRINDLEGTPHAISGTFDVYVARPVDINVFPEPGTPLFPGRPVRPQIRISPAMPAEVEFRFRHLPGSDPARAVERLIAGKANRWGVFVPEGDGDAVAFDEPGEYVCDVAVRHVDGDGVWWMAARRGASVVATPDSKVVAHGERGNRAPTQRWRARWFIARDSRFVAGGRPGGHDMGHTCYPYEPGDVAWLGHRDPDSLFPGVTIEDPIGAIADLIEARWPAIREGAGREGLYPDWLRPEDRRAIGELPLVCSSSAGLPPSMAPEQVDQWGYFYTTSWRPDVPVRSHVGEDLVPAAYWFFDDPYGYAFGVGPQGDLPGDVKMNYAGTVFRDRRTGLTHYGAYASMVVLIDGERDPIGRRVLPPFDGLVPGSPPSGPLLVIGGKRYDAFLTGGAVSPGAVLTSGDRLAISGVVWPPVSGFVRGEIASPSGRRSPFRGPSDAMGVFDVAGPVVREPGVWRVAIEGVCNGPTSVGRIADLVPEDRWPRGGFIGLGGNSFPVPVVPPEADPIAFDLPPGTRAAPPRPLAIRGRLQKAGSVRVLVNHPLGVLEETGLPVADGAFTYVYDAPTIAARFPNIDLTLPGPDPVHRQPAWYDTVTFTFWSGDGPDIRAGIVLLQGEDLYATAWTGRPAPGEAPKPAPAPPPAEEPPPRRPEKTERSPAARSSLLAMSRDGRSLFAGHPWSGEVVRLGAGKGTLRMEASAKTGGQVRSLALAPDENRLYVALSDARHVVVLDAGSLKELDRWTLPAEPWAALPSADGSAVFAADYDGNRVLRLNAATGVPEASSPPIPRPSALTLVPAREAIGVAGFRTGEVVELDLRCRLLRRLPANEQLNQCQALTVGPDGTLYAPQTRSDTRLGGRMFDRTVFPVVAAAGPSDARMEAAFFPDLLTVPPHRPCDAAVDAGALYLACAGSDDVVALDLGTKFPRWHARDVGLEPGAIVMDPVDDVLYVLTVAGQEIVVLDARDGRVRSRLRFAHDPTPSLIARGRYLFGTAVDKRLTKDRWISCASCHPDGGGEDGRQWDLGEGPLDTRSLRGSTACAPLHYAAHLDEIQDTFRFTRQVMAGRWFVDRRRINDPLGRSNAGFNRDLDALAAYVESLWPKRPPGPPPELLPLVQRGKAVFESARAGCATCHPPPLYTDSGRRNPAGAFLRHDVGTWKPGEAESLRLLDTPSLLGLRQSEPYLHDGRAATLEEVFTRHNPRDRHGITSHLSEEEVRALSAFLRHLDPGPSQASPRIVRPAVPPVEYDRGDPVRAPPGD